MNSYTLDDALKRIEQLEAECALLREKLQKYENHEPAGRKKHNAQWTACYDQFVELYETGNSVKMIVEKTDFSRRTVYRYKEYYDQLHKNTDPNHN